MLMAPPPEGGTVPGCSPLNWKVDVWMSRVTKSVVTIAPPYCLAELAVNVLPRTFARHPVVAYRPPPIWALLITNLELMMLRGPDRGFVSPAQYPAPPVVAAKKILSSHYIVYAQPT